MINKENKYREEIFELLRSNLTEIDDSPDVLNLLKQIFITDEKDLSNDEIIDKLTDL
jgi:hypothetical protein